MQVYACLHMCTLIYTWPRIHYNVQLTYTRHKNVTASTVKKIDSLKSESFCVLVRIFAQYISLLMMKRRADLSFELFHAYMAYMVAVTLDM